MLNANPPSSTSKEIQMASSKRRHSIHNPISVSFLLPVNFHAPITMCRSTSLPFKALRVCTKKPCLKAKFPSHPPLDRSRRVHFSDTPVVLYIEPSTFGHDQNNEMVDIPNNTELPTLTTSSQWMNRDDLRRSLFTKALEAQQALSNPKFTSALRDLVWKSSRSDDDVQMECNESVLDLYRGLERTCLVKLLQSKSSKKLCLFDPKEHPKLIAKSVVRFQEHLKMFGKSDQGELLRIHYSRYTGPACKFASLLASPPRDGTLKHPSKH